MKQFNQAFKEYICSLKFSKKSRLVWTGTDYRVSYFFSDVTLKKLCWEIVI